MKSIKMIKHDCNKLQKKIYTKSINSCETYLSGETLHIAVINI